MRRTVLALLCLVALPLLVACERPADGEVSPDVVASVDADVERGRYLVEGLLQCFVCHSERDWDRPGAPPVEGRKGAGRLHFDDGTSRIVAHNLTPDEETGIGRWTDAQLARAIREGISPDGRVLARTMPYRYYRHLSDADVAAVITYLRSLEPVHNSLPTTVRSADAQARLDAEERERLEPVDLSLTDPVERGRGLIKLAGCQGCHTAWEAPHMPGLMAGGNVIDGPNGNIFSTNVTSHASGMPYDAAAFIEVMRTGKQGALYGHMPWIVYRNLSDADLRAIHAFLHTQYPVAHFINNHAAPTPCEVCGQVHGLGELNRIERPRGITLDPATFHRYVGTYRSEEDDALLRVVVVDGRWLAYLDDDEAPLEMIPLSETRYLVLQEALPLRFIFGADGRAVRVVTEDLYRIVMERVE